MKTPATIALAAILALLGGPRFVAASGDPGLPSAAAPSIVLEYRGEATARRTLDRLGIDFFSIAYDDEEAALGEFFRSRDATFLTLGPADEYACAFVYTLAPEDRAALFALYAAENWTVPPDVPDGWHAFVPPSRAHTNYHSAVGNKLLYSESPDNLRAAIAALPALPDTLPAEGDFAVQLSGADFAAFLGDGPDDIAEAAAGLATVTAGVGIDGDTAAFHAVFTPVPGSEFADDCRAWDSIPPSAACVNLPDAAATFANGSGSRTLRPGADRTPDGLLARAQRRGLFADDRWPAYAAALFPAARPGAIPRVLAFADGVPASARPDLLLDVARHRDAFALAADTYRGISVDTLSVASPYALAPLLERFLDLPADTAGTFAAALASPLVSWRAAWLPGGLLVAFADNDSALLRAAIDAALDGTAIPFDQSPAFRAAFPHPDAPASLIGHVEVSAVLDLHPVGRMLFPDIPAPCPVDFFFARLPGDGSIVLRLRAPVALVRALFSSGENASEDADPPPPSEGRPSPASGSPVGGSSSLQPASTPWDTATPIQTTPETLTFRDIEPERLAFWRDFLGEPPAGTSVAPWADDIARFLAFGGEAPEASALLDRAFPELDRDALPPPWTLPWVFASTALREASGRIPDPAAAWHSFATAIDPASSPVAPADLSWRENFALALAADRYLNATADRSDPDTRARRDSLRALGARHAAHAVAQANPGGLRGRVFLILLAPEKPNFTAAPATGGLSPIGAVFEEIGCTNAVASVILSRDEKQWAWALRGGGWASTVTDEGWRGFRTHLDKAVAHALRARALEPRWPEPWHALMAPAGAGRYAAESLEGLARGALERQIDYVWALDPLFNFSLPRWCNGGAPACLRALRAVVDIPRTDVATPFKALEKLDFLVDDQLSYGRAAYARAGFPAPLDTDPRLWPAFRDMFERYLADPDSAVSRPELLRAYLQTAARFRDPAPALAAINRLPPDEADALWTEPRNPDVPRGASLVGVLGIDGQDIAAHIDSIAPGARALHAVAVAARDKKAAQAALDEIHEKFLPISFWVPLHDAILDRMSRDQSIAFDWEPGDGWDSINRLRPITFYREGSAALRLPTGGWLFWGQDDARGASIDFWRKKTTCAAADFTVLSLPGGADPADAGFFVRLHAGPAFCVGVAVNPFAGTAQAYLTDPEDFHVRVPFADVYFAFDPLPLPDGGSPTGLPTTFRLRVRCENGLLDAWLDGAPLFPSIPVPDDFPRKPDYHPAFGTTSPLPGPVYSVDRIRLAKH